MKKVAFHTLGCKVNQYETEAVSQLFLDRGYELVSFADQADVYIVNTCTVTNLGDKKSRQMIRRAKQLNPEAIVVAMGCYAQVRPEEVSFVEGVNLVIGTKDRDKVLTMVESYDPAQGVILNVRNLSENESFEHMRIENFQERSRAFIKIQDGCSQFCSYCIIPYARGPVRSRSPEDILEEVQGLVKNGYKEIVLTGIHVASYGKDLNMVDLLGLIKKAHAVPGLERIRLSSMEPNAMTEPFCKEIAQLEKICDHFHLSLQSGCDKTLKQMNRKYNTENFSKAVNLIRGCFPDAAITTDMIVGFPGETEEDFSDSYHFARQMNFRKIHVFPYSPKKGTPAASFDNQVPVQIKNDRAATLNALSRNMENEFLKSMMGKSYTVLFESVDNGIVSGFTTNYVEVKVKTENPVINQVKPVIIEKVCNEFVMGIL